MSYAEPSPNNSESQAEIKINFRYIVSIKINSPRDVRDT